MGNWIYNFSYQSGVNYITLYKYNVTLVRVNGYNFVS